VTTYLVTKDKIDLALNYTRQCAGDGSFDYVMQPGLGLTNNGKEKTSKRKHSNNISHLLFLQHTSSCLIMSCVFRCTCIR
jgi:hypothetical protein